MEGSKLNVGKRVVINKVRFDHDPTHQPLMGKTGVISRYINRINCYDIKLDTPVDGVGKSWRALACNVSLVPPLQPDIDMAAVEKTARDLWEGDEVEFDDVLTEADFSPSDGGCWVRGWLWVPTGGDD